jgi:hypothetical protein
MTLVAKLPSIRVGDLPFPMDSLPQNYSFPAAKIDSVFRLSGDDLSFEKLLISSARSSAKLSGTFHKVLTGAFQPDISVSADLDLPQIVKDDLPLTVIPLGFKLPPSRWKTEFSYTARLLKIKSLRAWLGHNDLEVQGSVIDPSGLATLDLLLKSRSFDLEELAQLTKSISDLKIGGTGLFAMSITGRKEKPLYAGKVQFKGVHGLVADLPLSDFTGTVTFDDRRIDVPNLKGKIVDGALSMDLTVKDYLRSPDVLLEAKLDRFDLGRWLAAQSKVSEERKKRGQAQSPNVATKPLTVSTRGHWDIGLLSHPRATVSDVKVAWDLRGVSSDFRILNGDATFHVGEGNIHSLGDVAAQSKLVKVLVFPLLIVQNIGRLGGIKLFPNFNDIKLHHVIGDYIFRNGIMNLRQSEMDSDAAHVSAQGTIDLPGENLDLVMTAQVANFAPIDVGVKGTFANPKTKVDIGKFLAEPAKQLIQGLNKAQVGDKVLIYTNASKAILYRPSDNKIIEKAPLQVDSGKPVNSAQADAPAGKVAGDSTTKTTTTKTPTTKTQTSTKKATTTKTPANTTDSTDTTTGN